MGGSSETPTITADEFERAYAERSGLTVEELRRRGRTVRRCKCGEEGCEGWQSISWSRIREEEEDWRAGIYRAPDWIKGDQ